MSEPSNADVMRAIGELTADVRHIKSELELSRENRKLLYEKLEEQGITIAEMGVRLQIAQETSIKARDEVKKQAEQVAPLVKLGSDLETVVAFQKDATKTGKILIWLLSIAGVSLLSGVIWLGELITAYIRVWLGIPPPG
jgi:hypothetical protein